MPFILFGYYMINKIFGMSHYKLLMQINTTKATSSQHFFLVLIHNNTKVLQEFKFSLKDETINRVII